MSPDPAALDKEERERRIRDAAYRRFQARSGEADPVKDWLEAEIEIDNIEASNPNDFAEKRS